MTFYAIWWIFYDISNLTFCLPQPIGEDVGTFDISRQNQNNFWHLRFINNIWTFDISGHLYKIFKNSNLTFDISEIFIILDIRCQILTFQIRHLTSQNNFGTFDISELILALRNIFLISILSVNKTKHVSIWWISRCGSASLSSACKLVGKSDRFGIRVTTFGWSV